MLYHHGMLAGVGLDGLGPNLGLGNLAMGYPHSFILGLANQGQEGSELLRFWCMKLEQVLESIPEELKKRLTSGIVI